MEEVAQHAISCHHAVSTGDSRLNTSRHCRKDARNANALEEEEDEEEEEEEDEDEEEEKEEEEEEEKEEK